MKLWLKPEDRRPGPDPVMVDERRAFIVGSIAWAIALVVTIVLGPQLPEQWLWTAVAGIVLGLLGLLYTQYRRRR